METFVDKSQVMDFLQDLRDVEAMLRVAVNAQGIAEPDRVRVTEAAIAELRRMAGAFHPFLPHPEQQAEALQKSREDVKAMFQVAADADGIDEMDRTRLKYVAKEHLGRVAA